MTLLLSSLANTLIIVGALFIAFIVIFILITRKSSSSWSTLREPLEIGPPPSTVIKEAKFIPSQFFSENCYIKLFLWTNFKSLLGNDEISVAAFEIEETEVTPLFGREEDNVYLFSLNEALALSKELLQRFHIHEKSPIALDRETTYYIYFGENQYSMAKIKLEYSDNLPGYGWTLEKETASYSTAPFCRVFRRKVSETIVEEQSIT